MPASVLDCMTSSNPELQQAGTDWDLVLARDGTVLAVTEGAPCWVGMRLAECADAPEDVREAGHALLERANRSGRPTGVTVPLRSGEKRVRLHLTVVEALPVRRVSTDLRSLLRSSLDVLQRQAKSLDVALTIEIQDELEPVPLDAEKIAWVVTALVGNALRYVRHGSHTMPGGTITVRAGFSEAADTVTIEVQDDGPGISPDRLRGLSGSERSGAGVGLGLSMVREVVMAHGGTFEITSDTDALHPGTTIRLRLPVGSVPLSAASSHSI
jgi:signal transduction histidine kinase